jgi:hypothetical protein
MNFSPPRGRSTSKKATTATAPPTAARRAQVQLLCTLMIISTSQAITAEEMKAYDNIFATPIPIDIILAIARLVDCELSDDLEAPPRAVVPDG